MYDRLIFAKRLKQAREEKQMRQNVLANSIGVSAATISAYESLDDSKGKTPTLEKVANIAEKLGVSIDWLCGNEKNRANGNISVEKWLKYLVDLINNPQTTNYSAQVGDLGYCDLETPVVKVSVDDYTDENNCGALLYFYGEDTRKFFDEVTTLQKLSGSLPADMYSTLVNAVIEKHKQIFELDDLPLSLDE